MSLRALICSSPIADITLTTKSFPSAKPSLICPYSKQENNQLILRTASKGTQVKTANLHHYVVKNTTTNKSSRKSQGI